jgi:glycosyltransferase A (GT-A) superfamily protein (DUF2064 family)
VTAACLVMAKSPVPGRVKSRLGAVVGAEYAARLASAALADTLGACADAFAAGARYIALEGQVGHGVDADQLAAALDGWTVLRQLGPTLGDRITHAHRQVHARGHAPVVQIGMDTPHVDRDLLGSVADRAARTGRPVLGPCHDGGWWVLATTRADQVVGMGDVPMSRTTTFRDTAALLAAHGAAPVLTRTMRDVDEVADAVAVADTAPGTLFARRWSR